MTSARIWHPSRDPYHCAFRIVRLLEASQDRVLELERARVLDMFLLFPALLHRTSMTDPVRRRFRELAIEKPEKQFIHLPSAAAVFQDLRVYQNSAITQMAARGLLSPSGLRNGSLNAEGVPEVIRHKAVHRNETDGGLTAFLTGTFSLLPTRGAESIYRRAGLPSRNIFL